jgi:hypothetical protein
MWSVVPDIYNAFTAANIESSIFTWTYLRCYWRYIDNSVHVILQTWCQIQRISSRLRYVNCGPGHIQFIYSSAHSDFNIQLKVSALLLEISRQFNARYTTTFVPNTEHMLRFTICLLWSRAYTMQLQLRILRLQHSTESTWAAIVDMPTFGCALYWKFGAIYSAQQPVCALWIVVPTLYNVIIAPYIWASIFSWRYLLCNWRYHANSMRVILKNWCQV